MAFCSVREALLWRILVNTLLWLPNWKSKFAFVFVRLLSETLVVPLQERLDDWKKAVVQMDKDHAKGKCKN